MKQKFSLSLSLALIMAMLVTSLALADNVENNVESVPASITLQAGIAASYVDVQFWIQATSNDGDPQCNFDTPAEQLTFTVNTPSGISATPSSLTFNKCKDGGNYNAQTVRFAASASATSGNISFTTTYNNSGGSFNYANAIFYVNVLPGDTTPPVITPNVVGTLGDNGWYVSDVTVSWSVVDDESSYTINSGCDTTLVNYDTAGVTLGCTATSTGGTSSQSVTIKRDATAPMIVAAAMTSPNVAGWYNGDVTVHFTCNDTGSGIPTGACPADQLLSTEGMAVSSTEQTITDAAGNTSDPSNVVIVKIDKTAPMASASALPGPNTNSWNNTNVTVSFNGSDALSGIASCFAPVVLSSEGAGQSASGSCTDFAGNSASATASGINIDKTAPTVSASASPAPNANGWNNTDVTVSFSGSDALSGIDSCSAPVTLSSEGAGQSASGSCTDLAGNSASATASGINIDKTSPTVSLVGGPANGGVYYFGFVPAAPTCLASDALSGLDGTCSVSGYSNAVGNHTVNASVSDKAGNSASASASYEVKAWTLSGFYQPVDMNGVWNTVKGGSTLPFKFEVFAGSSELTDTAVVKSFVANAMACPVTSMIADEIEFTTTGGTSLRYDGIAGQFINNWQTPKKPGACYKVTMTTQDDSSLSAFFKLK